MGRGDPEHRTADSPQKLLLIAAWFVLRHTPAGVMDARSRLEIGIVLCGHAYSCVPGESSPLAPPQPLLLVSRGGYLILCVTSSTTSSVRNCHSCGLRRVTSHRLCRQCFLERGSLGRKVPTQAPCPRQPSGTGRREFDTGGASTSDFPLEHLTARGRSVSGRYELTRASEYHSLASGEEGEESEPSSNT